MMHLSKMIDLEMGTERDVRKGVRKGMVVAAAYCVANPRAIKLVFVFLPPRSIMVRGGREKRGGRGGVYVGFSLPCHFCF
jgi:hypothetical protein